MGESGTSLELGFRRMGQAVVTIAAERGKPLERIATQGTAHHVLERRTVELTYPWRLRNALGIDQVQNSSGRTSRPTL